MKERIIKIIICIILVIFLTGCQVNYELTLEKDTIKEEITINDNITELRNIEMIKSDYEKAYPIYSKESQGFDEISCDENCYIKELIKSDATSYLYTLKSNDNYDNFKNKNTYLLSSDLKSYLKDDKSIIISISNGLKYYELFDNVNNINISIKTTLPVKENNADKVENNTYTWNYTKDNYQNKKLFINVSLEQEEIKEKEEKKKEKNNISKELLITIIVIIVLYFGIIIFISKKK